MDNIESLEIVDCCVQDDFFNKLTTKLDSNHVLRDLSIHRLFSNPPQSNFLFNLKNTGKIENINLGITSNGDYNTKCEKAIDFGNLKHITLKASWFTLAYQRHQENAVNQLKLQYTNIFSALYGNDTSNIDNNNDRTTATTTTATDMVNVESISIDNDIDSTISVNGNTKEYSHFKQLQIESINIDGPSNEWEEIINVFIENGIIKNTLKQLKYQTLFAFNGYDGLSKLLEFLKLMCTLNAPGDCAFVFGTLSIEGFRNMNTNELNQLIKNDAFLEILSIFNHCDLPIESELRLHLRKETIDQIYEKFKEIVPENVSVVTWYSYSPEDCGVCFSML